MTEGFPVNWGNEGSVIILSYSGGDGDMKRQSDLYRTSHLAEGQASRIIHPCESQPGALCVWPRCSGDVTNETWISLPASLLFLLPSRHVLNEIRMTSDPYQV